MLCSSNYGGLWALQGLRLFALAFGPKASGFLANRANGSRALGLGWFCQVHEDLLHPQHVRTRGLENGAANA